MDRSNSALTDLEKTLLSDDKEIEIKRIKELLLQEENRIKKLKMKGCKPEEFDNYNKELQAIYAAYKILDVYERMEI